MKTQNFFTLTILILSFFLSNSNAQSISDLWGDALGTEYKSFNDKNFLRILDRAKTKANNMLRVSASDLKITTYSQDNTSTTWHLPIYADNSAEFSGGKYSNSYEITYKIIPSAFINYGGYMTFTFLSQEIKEDFFEAITTSEDFLELKDEFAEEFDDMKTDISLLGKRVMVTANYSYRDGVSMGDLDEHMVYLIKWARRVQSYVMVAEDNRASEWKSNLREKEYTYFKKDEFVALTGYGFDKYEEEYEPAKEGYYNLKLGGYNHMIYNYGDSLVLNVWIDAPDGIADEDINKIWDEINEEITDDSFPESKYSRVYMYDKWPTTYWLEVSFDISQGFEGSDFEELFDKYVEEYVPDFSENLNDLFEDYE